jgi:micrococcal nuclease
MRKLAIFFVAICIPVLLSAHPGGLDKNGCHTNHKTGEYHCHGSPKTSTPSTPSTSKSRSEVSRDPVVAPSAVIAPSATIDFSSIDVAPPMVRRFAGKVVAVEDGDTITVMNGGSQEKIRLYGIDCPEGGQAFSEKAKQFTSNQTFGKVVSVIPYERDRYGRTVADIILPDSKSLSHEIVRAGLAWWFQKYAPEEQLLSDLEKEAHASRRGLWFDANPTAPWNFRHPEPDMSREDISTPVPQRIASPTPAHEKDEIVYITKTGSKFHRAGCPHLRSMIATTRGRAIASGYSPCSVCKP